MRVERDLKSMCLLGLTRNGVQGWRADSRDPGMNKASTDKVTALLVAVCTHAPTLPPSSPSRVLVPSSPERSRREEVWTRDWLRIA